MSKRLQVIFDPQEYNDLKRHAKRERLSLGAWVRESLRRITANSSLRSPADKLRALQRAHNINAPISDPAQLKAEIVSGYSDKGSR